jgi:hypothetical protein
VSFTLLSPDIVGALKRAVEVEVEVEVNFIMD